MDSPPSDPVPIPAAFPVASPVVFVVGPTAVGKTRLAVVLARRFGGEIINADSRQVYRRMDVGTGKPSPEERRQAPHHLLDVLDPDEDFGLATFLSLARAAMSEIKSRGRLPIVAGGAGQYIWALIEGWQTPEVAPDQAFRRRKEEEAERHGAGFVYRQLQDANPARAARLDPRNLRRVIRALEVLRAEEAAGPAAGHGGGASPGPLENTLIIGLTAPRERLYERIDARVDLMLDGGLEREAAALAASGFSLGSGPLGSPGYRELGQYLAGEITLEEAVTRAKFQTHRMARRQYTWFKPGDERIRWLDCEDPDLDGKAAALVREFLAGNGPYGTIGAN